MSQTAPQRQQGGPPGRGGRPGGPPGRGGRPGQQSDRPRRPRREPVEEVWEPKTILGKKVASGEITTMEEIYEKVYVFKKPELLKNYCLI